MNHQNMLQANNNSLPHTLVPEKWVARYADYFYSYSYMKTNDAELSRDLVQDCFLSALQYKDSFKGESSEKTWLARILNNKIIDHYRKKRPTDDYETYLNSTENAFEQAFFGENEYGRWTQRIPPMQYANAADAHVQTQEFQAGLDICLHKMPPKIKRVFVDKYIDEKTADEICAENEISNSNYWVIIHRAKVLLRSCLEKTQVI